MIVKEFLRYGDKLCIVKKRINSERINDVSAAKNLYEAEHCVKNPHNPFEYIFLQIIPDLHYEQIIESKGNAIKEHNEIRQEETEQNNY